MKFKVLLDMQQEKKLNSILYLASMTCCFLIGARLFIYQELMDQGVVQQVGHANHFYFLLWNLFLAWVPFGLATLVSKQLKNAAANPMVILMLALSWLLF
ncbi:MAG: hypothetical protein AAF705_09790, partial [Bacteroidota bacterium]